MKKFLTALLSVLWLGFGVGLAGCDRGQTQVYSVRYYGVVQTMEEYEGLVVYIPTVGVCEFPSYEDGKQQSVTIQDGDLLCMEFQAEAVVFLERSPVEIKTPVESMTVEMKNVGLSQKENAYIITVAYTQSMEEEFLLYEKGVGDTVYFVGSEGVAGTVSTPSVERVYAYCTEIIENIVSGRVSFCLQLGERTIQEFLYDFAEQRIRLDARFEEF